MSYLTYSVRHSHLFTLSHCLSWYQRYSRKPDIYLLRRLLLPVAVGSISGAILKRLQWLYRIKHPYLHYILSISPLLLYKLVTLYCVALIALVFMLTVNPSIGKLIVWFNAIHQHLRQSIAFYPIPSLNDTLISVLLVRWCECLALHPPQPFGTRLLQHGFRETHPYVCYTFTLRYHTLQRRLQHVDVHTYITSKTSVLCYSVKILQCYLFVKVPGNGGVLAMTKTNVMLAMTKMFFK